VRVGRTSSQDLGVDFEAGIVVATSALEVGYDDPEVGAVLQHKAPQSASAYLQRKGRAGRKQDMRPWMVIVLSDFGRDRNAFQTYEQLFSPSLGARYLPLTNRAVLKMQGTFALFDWLARKIPSNVFANPWSDFSRPSSEVPNTAFSEKAAQRETIYIHNLKSLLSDTSTREDFARFLGRSLSITPDKVDALMWDPPRSIMMEAVPTLLRRLESGWRSFSSSGKEIHTPQSPLPEFVPKTLFSDLQLPEVIIGLPGQGQIPARSELMPVANALKEFSPGRVSRRFGVSHGNEKYWIPNGSSPEILIDGFCPATDRQDLGHYRYVNPDGIVEFVRVFRPHALAVQRTPINIQQSSNSFLEWLTEIVPTDKGHSLDLPESRRWNGILKSIEIHSHHLGLPLEVRRFAKSLTAVVGQGRQPPNTTKHCFAYDSGSGCNSSGALGFATDVDGVRIAFSYPDDIVATVSRDALLVRGLRSARFRDLLRDNPTLSNLANTFQVDWLAQIFQSVAIVASLRLGISLVEAVELERSGQLGPIVEEVVNTIMQANWIEETESPEEPDDDEPAPLRASRRLQELTDLLANAAVKAALREAVPVLWQPIDQHWEPWLRRKFKATLGTAILEAAFMLCPRVEEGSLVLNLNALVTTDVNLSVPSNEEEIWLTETTVGGGGFIEEFVLEYSKNPRRFLRLIDSKLSPSDLEDSSEELVRIVQMAAQNLNNSNEISAAFFKVRSATNHSQSSEAAKNLRAALSSAGITPTMTLLVALNTRILHPGTSEQTDAYLASALDEWRSAEESLDINIDVRVFALVKSADPTLSSSLGVAGLPSDIASTASWRYSVLYGLLWPTGPALRTEGLRTWSPFEHIPDCDRLLVSSALAFSMKTVLVSGMNWFEEFAENIVSDGVVELEAMVDETSLMSQAILRVAADPVDSEALLVHARLTGVRKERDRLVSTFELPEAPQ
jgi:hypothetical protein